MPGNTPYRFKTITEYHRQVNLPAPAHPLISVIDVESVTPPIMEGSFSVVLDFYSISMKRAYDARFKYGQHACDFDGGTLFFMAPGQVLGIDLDRPITKRPTGWMIFFHPDLLWNTPLAKAIKQYAFFDYSVNEALYLSDKEEAMINTIAGNLQQEYEHSIDVVTQKILVAQLELLLSYAERFYQRQFITRKAANHEVLTRLEDLLNGYFNSGALATQGLPSVTWIAESLHMSPNYLSSLLKSLTGQTTQQHLHEKLIELAKQKLSTTNMSVSEIAYELGFEHLQSFSKLFKHKTQVSPLAFRQSFN